MKTRQNLLHKYVFPVLLVLGMGAMFNNDARGAEHGTGVYLMGSKGPMAGIVPEPGLYFQNDLFYYRAKAGDRKSTRLNSSHVAISYAVFCLKKKTKIQKMRQYETQVTK